MELNKNYQKPLHILFLGLVWLNLVGSNALGSDNLFSQPPTLSHAFTKNLECEIILGEFTQQVNWLEDLVNPILTTPQQAADRYHLYKDVNDCLDQVKNNLPSENISAIEYFTDLYIAIYGEDGEKQLVPIGSIEDPAIVAMRDETGIPPPQGYVILRFFPNRSTMPEIIRSAFKNPQTKGATFMMRYIAILDEEKEFYYQQELQSKTLPSTIQHELVHAYSNSVLGLEHYDAFPKWFSEGLAIYYSGSGQSYSVNVHYGGDFYTKHTIEPTKEYEQYRTIFDFLESTLGRQQLLSLIRQSFETHEVSVVYKELGINSQEELFMHANNWKNRQKLLYDGLVILGSAFLLTAGIIGYSWYFQASKCYHCKKPIGEEDILIGRCPHCGSRINEDEVY